jgi:hypothetical protein
MKLGYKLLFGACVAANLVATSCVDDMKFGNSFLEKAPGGSATRKPRATAPPAKLAANRPKPPVRKSRRRRSSLS